MKNSGKAENNVIQSTDDPLPVASLRLLAPPLRLVSAAAWKVMQQRDVMQYGKLEEFVTSVSDSVRGLLSFRHQAKLTVGLRARLILEQLRMSQSPERELIVPQLERVCVPTVSKGKRKDQKVEMAVKNFHALVHTLLKNPARRKQFFQEEFDSQYGPQYDLALEKLLWEFLTRLDQLLPVPDLAQTVSWLNAAPVVLEECARSATQPQLLQTLLQHENCLGHLDSAGSIPSSTGDSILSSLSLPPSGRVRYTNQSGSGPAVNTGLSPATSTERSTRRQTRRTVSQIAPVFGTISTKDIPQRASVNQDVLDSEEELRAKDTSSFTRIKLRSCSKSKSVSEEEQFVGNMLVTVVSQSSTSSEKDDSDEAQERPVRKNMSRRSSVSEKREMRRGLEQDRKIKEKRLEDGSKVSLKTAQDVASLGEKNPTAILSSCMKRQLRVIIPRLDIKDVTQRVLNTTVNKEQTTKPPRQSSTERNGDSSRKRKLSCTWTPEKNMNSAADKQVCAGSPCIPTVMFVRTDSSEMASPVIESTDDIIVDSEDEAVEKVKGSLFSTRYCKTKNNTYVPTLHEFWTPAFFRRDLVSPGNGYR